MSRIKCKTALSYIACLTNTLFLKHKPPKKDENIGFEFGKVDDLKDHRTQLHLYYFQLCISSFHIYIFLSLFDNAQRLIADFILLTNILIHCQCIINIIVRIIKILRKYHYCIENSRIYCMFMRSKYFLFH